MTSTGGILSFGLSKNHLGLSDNSEAQTPSYFVEPGASWLVLALLVHPIPTQISGSRCLNFL